MQEYFVAPLVVLLHSFATAFKRAATALRADDEVVLKYSWNLEKATKLIKQSDIRAEYITHLEAEPAAAWMAAALANFWP